MCGYKDVQLNLINMFVKYEKITGCTCVQETKMYKWTKVNSRNDIIECTCGVIN